MDIKFSQEIRLGDLVVVGGMAFGIIKAYYHLDKRMALIEQQMSAVVKWIESAAYGGVVAVLNPKVKAKGAD